MVILFSRVNLMVAVNKDEDDMTKRESKKAQCSLKGKTIIIVSFGLDECLDVSRCKTTKQMWDTLLVIHNGTTKIKREIINTLIHEYELFIIKTDKNIYEMKKRFIHAMNHMRTREELQTQVYFKMVRNSLFIGEKMVLKGKRIMGLLMI